MPEIPLKICPECLTSLYMSYTACPYCDAPEKKEKIEALLEKRDMQHKKIVVYAVLVLLGIGAAFLLLDHFLPACQNCASSMTGFSIRGAGNEISFLDAAFNPGISP